ncbi:MAG: EAL domain-containing protein [Steroidobacteraceae bacterium]
MHAAALHSAHSEDSGATAAPQSVEALGRRICEALPPLRLHSVSICDNQCNVLWLSEGALGPDEHALVTEALERFGSAAESFEARVEDGRVAVFLAVRGARAGLAGLVMVLADTKAGGEGLLGRIATGPVQALIRELGAAIPHAPARRIDHDPTGMLLSLADEASPVEAAAAAPAVATDLAPAAVDELLAHGELSLELEPRDMHAAPPVHAPSPPPEAPVLHPAPPAPPAAAAPAIPGSPTESVALEVMPFVKLRSGGRMRRFEVLPRGTPRQNRDPAALDALAMQSLLAWMAAHRSDWTLEPTAFTLNLSIATLEDEQFLRQISSGFSQSGISPENIGFEIAEPLCTQRRASVERFISGCERLGCFVVIDGFTFDSAVVSLLRSKAVRLVKIEPRLCAAALKDKLAQAVVVAIVQAVKVLGIHCAAQQIETQQALRWLTAVGCDFGQGSMLARPRPIARLQASASA